MTDSTTKTETKPADSTSEVAADPAALWKEFDVAEAPPTEKPEGRDQEAKPVQEKVETTEAKAGDTPAAESKPEAKTAEEKDIWANATPEQKAYIDTLTQSARSAAGRMSALMRRYPELFDGRGEVVERQPGSPAPKKAVAPSKEAKPPLAEDPDVKKLKEDFPEVAGPVMKMFEAQAEKTKEIQDQLDRRSASDQKSQFLENERLLGEQHSDWKEVAATPQFMAWLDAQPQLVKAAAQRNGDAIVNLEEAAFLFDTFKLAQGKAAAPNPAPPKSEDPPKTALSAKRQAQLESSVTPTAKGAPKASTGVSDDPKQAWAEFERMGL